MAKETAPKKLVKRPTAQKRALQSEKKRVQNRAFKSSVRTAIRGFETVLTGGDPSAIKENLSLVYSMMDKGVKKGVFSVNKASRTKARLTARTVIKNGD